MADLTAWRLGGAKTFLLTHSRELCIDDSRRNFDTGCIGSECSDADDHMFSGPRLYKSMYLSRPKRNTCSASDWGRLAFFEYYFEVVWNGT